MEKLLFAFANKKFPIFMEPKFYYFCTKIKARGFCIEHAENKTVPYNIFVFLTYIVCAIWPVCLNLDNFMILHEGYNLKH